MTYPSSRRVGAVQGSQLAATGPEPSSGVGPAFHLDEPAPPLRSYLELGALPTAVPCARLHARHVLWEWGLNRLASDSELLVSELVTNAVKATAERDQAAVRLRLSGDDARVLIEVWDADPGPPAPQNLCEDGTPDPQEEGGRGLFLVAALSARWDWYPTCEPAGKIVWCEIRALSPARREAGKGREPRFVRMNTPADMGRRDSGPGRAWPSAWAGGVVPAAADQVLDDGVGVIGGRPGDADLAGADAGDGPVGDVGAGVVAGRRTRQGSGVFRSYPVLCDICD
jgi:anti-sigma regulatory factor (Ser/Thr protein kinase)